MQPSTCAVFLRTSVSWSWRAAASVGTAAVYRFVRPVAYQDFPQEALPAELKDGNPLGIWRLVEGKWGRD